MTIPGDPAHGCRADDIAPVLRTDAALDRIAAERRYDGTDPALRLVGALAALADGAPDRAADPPRRVHRREGSTRRASVATGIAALVVSISGAAVAAAGVGPLVPVLPAPTSGAAPSGGPPPHASAGTEAQAPPRHRRAADRGDRPRHGAKPRPTSPDPAIGVATLAATPRQPAAPAEPPSEPPAAQAGSRTQGAMTADKTTSAPRSGSEQATDPATTDQQTSPQARSSTASGGGNAADGTARPAPEAPVTDEGANGVASPATGSESEGTRTASTPAPAGNAHAPSADDHTGTADPPARSAGPDPSPSFPAPPTPSPYGGSAPIRIPNVPVNK